MDRFEFVVNDKLYKLETQADVLIIITFILEDEEITVIDRNKQTAQTHYGRWFIDKILEWLKRSALLPVVKFSNILEEITDESI